MTHKVLISGQTNLLLWGVSPHSRLERQLRALNIYDISLDSPTIAHNNYDIIFNGEYVFDSQSLKFFLEQMRPCALVYNEVVIGLSAGDKSDANLLSYLGHNISQLPQSVKKINTSDLLTYNDHLRRSEPPLVMPISADNLKIIEDRLYGNSYKGITDFVTKWIWPRPAKKVVRIFANLQITPNMVTLVSLILVIISSLLFLNGHFIFGLLLGWIMTFLDTVDGKLARVTVTSSRIGHILDHGMDIIHPPIWYACWASGLLLNSKITSEAADLITWWIVGGYILGRIIEGLFHALGSCSIFAWKPFDAICRLFTARRNPCLILLSVFTFAGLPHIGLFAVCVWTLFSSALMALRFLQAIFVRLSTGPLNSWLKNEKEAMENNPRLYKAFSSTRKAYE
mgnify:FL=1